MDEETTKLLQDWQHGDKSQTDRLFERLYGDLHKLAKGISLGKNARDTISATGLVAEAYLRFENGQPVNINDRQHFLALAVRIMRRIIIDRARHLGSLGQGGNVTFVEPDQSVLALNRSPDDIIALSEALDRLANVDDRLITVAELLIFGGLGVAEVAGVLDLNRRTIQRDIAEIGKHLTSFGYAAGL